MQPSAAPYRDGWVVANDQNTKFRGGVNINYSVANLYNFFWFLKLGIRIILFLFSIQFHCNYTYEF